MSIPRTLAERAEEALVVGVTGNIGAGKSTVCGILEEFGASRLDADEFAREVVRPGQPALEQIREVFGPSILRGDGTLDRARLGAHVFQTPSALASLEAILHPAIRLAVATALEERIQAGATIIVYEAALLLEKRLEDQMDKVLVVTAPMESKRSRVRSRDGLAAEEFDARIRQQMAAELQARKADIVLQNDGDIPLLRSRCKAAYKRLEEWYAEKCT